MPLLLTLVIACALSSATASANSIQFAQNGWSTGAILNVVFSGQDADEDGSILLSELTEFRATSTPSTGDPVSWNLPNIEPAGFVFTDLDNYLFLTSNQNFSLALGLCRSDDLSGPSLERQGRRGMGEPDRGAQSSAAALFGA
jgi:surface antigen